MRKFGTVPGITTRAVVDVSSSSSDDEDDSISEDHEAAGEVVITGDSNVIEEAESDSIPEDEQKAAGVSDSDQA